MEKYVTRDLEFGVWRTIEHVSHKTVRSNAVRRVFSQNSRIIDCKIIYVIFS